MVRHDLHLQDSPAVRFSDNAETVLEEDFDIIDKDLFSVFRAEDKMVIQVVYCGA